MYVYIDIYIYSIYICCIFIYNSLGTNNVYKNINLGRQTFNYKSVSLEILTNPTITVTDFIYSIRNHRETVLSNSKQVSACG